VVTVLDYEAMAGDPRPELVAIGNAVRRRREVKGWTTEALSQEAGVARRTVVYVEAGHVGTGIDTLLNICAALGATLAEIAAEAQLDPGE
jgi:XRE family aerobic/anaerobic benzoate catabolism transcriptional regulator